MRAGSSRRERVLVYGRSGAGKSSCWVSIANDILEMETDSQIYLGDTDHAFEAVADSDIAKVINCTSLDDYADYLTWVKELRPLVSPDDWVVVDMIDKAWSAAQDWFWQQMTGGDLLADIYLKNQKAINSKGAEGEYMGGAHGANWGIINKYYSAFFQTLISLPCHILCVTPAKEVREDAKPEEKNQYKIGWAPQGQKDLAHGFHTLLFAAETPGPKYIYTTIRERGPIGRPGRELLKGEQVDSEGGFMLSYLVSVAGWRP